MKKIFNINRKNKNSQGFTLVELVISISLIAILTSIIISVANFSDTRKNLTLARNELQAFTRLAQSYSLSIPDVSGEDICGFGVRYEAPNEYSVFYTFNSDVESSPDLCDSDPIFGADIAPPVIMRRVIIKDPKLTINLPADDGIAFFKSPYGDVLDDGQVFTITSSGDSSGSMSVTVSSSGRIN